MSKKSDYYHPCNKEKGYCVSLKNVTQPRGNYKGLSWFVILPNLNDLLNRQQFSIEKEAKTIGVVYKEKAQDNGVMLNYCPFCGSDLRPFRDDYLTKEST